MKNKFWNVHRFLIILIYETERLGLKSDWLPLFLGKNERIIIIPQQWRRDRWINVEMKRNLTLNAMWALLTNVFSLGQMIKSPRETKKYCDKGLANVLWLSDRGKDRGIFYLLDLRSNHNDFAKLVTSNYCIVDEMAETERSSFLPYGIESLETNKTFLNIRNSKRLWLTNCGFDNTGRILNW